MKMKLLIIHPIDSGSAKFGGIESFIRQMISVTPNDFDIEIVGLALAGDNLVVGKWAQLSMFGRQVNFFPAMRVSNPNKRTFIPLTFKFTLSLLRWNWKIRTNQKILLFHRIEPALAFYRNNGINILFSHGDVRNFENEFCESRWKMMVGAYYYFESKLMKIFKRVFVVSQSGCDYYNQKYPNCAQKFKFYIMGYNSEIFYVRSAEERNRIKLRYNFSRPIILFVGRLEYPKDPLLLIDTFSLIKKRYEGAKLIIIGEGSFYERILNSVREKNLLDDVILLGQKSSIEIAELMNISDLLLMTSAFEGMPIVSMEALACGLPVVSTDVGEIGLIIKNSESGVIVKSRSPDDISKAAVEIINNEHFPILSQESVSQYSQDKVLKIFFDEIKEFKK